jgi:hypothetical protein
LDLFGRFIFFKIPQIRAHVKGADLFLGMFWSWRRGIAKKVACGERRTPLMLLGINGALRRFIAKNQANP